MIAQKSVDLDSRLFYAINHGLYWRPLADLFYALATDLNILICLALALLVYYCYSGRSKTMDLFFFGSLTGVATYFPISWWIKPLINRPRPFQALADMHLCAPIGEFGRFSSSFPSTHSAAALALALVMMHIDNRLRTVGWIFALVIGFGTIYTGGHYPGDVFAGYGFGFLSAKAMILIREKFKRGMPSSITK